MAQKTNGVLKTNQGTNMSTNSQSVYYINFSTLGTSGSPCVWNINLPTAQNQVKRLLKITSANTNLIGHNGNGFMPTYAVKSTVCSGYYDQNNNPTNVLAYISPTSVNTFVSDDQQYFNIFYQLTNEDQIWDIGLATTISLSIVGINGDDQTPILCGDVAPTVVIKLQRVMK